MTKNEKIAEGYLRAKWAMLDEERNFQETASDEEYDEKQKRIKDRTEELEEGLARSHRISLKKFKEILASEEADRPGLAGTKYHDLVRSLRAECVANEHNKPASIRYDKDGNPIASNSSTAWKFLLVVLALFFVGYCVNRNQDSQGFSDCLELYRDGAIQDPSICVD